MNFLISPLVLAVLLQGFTATASPTDRRGIKQGFSRSRVAASLTHPLPATRLRSRSPGESGTYSALAIPGVEAVYSGTDVVSVSAAITVPVIVAYAVSNSGAPSSSGSDSKADYEDGSETEYAVGGTAGIRIGGSLVVVGASSSSSSGLSGTSAAAVSGQLEAGVMWYGMSSGSDDNQALPMNYSAYYEWLPGPMGFFSFDVSAGDLVKVRLEMSSSTSGVAYAENSNTGQTASRTITGPTATPTVAAWQVGAYDYDGEPVWEAQFSPFTFSGCAGTEADGSTFDLVGASVYYPSASSGSSGGPTACRVYPEGGSSDLQCYYVVNSGS